MTPSTKSNLWCQELFQGTHLSKIEELFLGYCRRCAWRQFTITPQLSYVFPLCDDAKYDMRTRSMQIDTAFADRQSSYLVGGVVAMVSF